MSRMEARDHSPVDAVESDANKLDSNRHYFILFICIQYTSTHHNILFISYVHYSNVSVVLVPRLDLLLLRKLPV